MHKFQFLIFLVLSISLTPFAFSDGIPDWVKNTAGWWSDRQISQSEFTDGLEFLINEGIIYVPSTEPAPPGPDKIIPDWVRYTAGWWSDNLIPDSEFANAMKYLIEIGIIDVKVSSPEIILEDNVSESIEIESPLNIVLDGNPAAHANTNFELDIKVHDSSIYSGNEYSIHRNGLDGVDVNIQLFNQEGELIHNFNAVTKYKGLVEYVVLATETSKSKGTWLINNTYTAKVSATLGERTDEKSWEFIGLPHELYYNQGSGTRAPIGLTATAGDDKITLAWTAPTGVSSITDYKIEYCKIEPPTHNGCPSYDSNGNDSGNHWTAFDHEPTDIAGCNNVTIKRTTAEGGNYTLVVCDADVSDVVTGLENETQYLFRVAVINYSGTGAYSGTVTATTT